MPSTLPTSIALVPEYAGFDTRELLLVAAAIQRQIARDVAPLWNVNATVAPFESLEEVPIGYWPILVTTRALDGQDGTHLDSNGAPYALVEAQPHWSLAASHECIEMILDPFGNRTVPAASPTGAPERVEVLLEVCDPCQGDDCAYLIDDVLVADFVTPAYFAGDTRGARYCFSGRITEPLGLVSGGYLSWHDPATGSWWQRSMEGGKATDLELGPLEGAGRGARSVRELVDGFTRHHRRIARSVSPGRLAEARDRAAAGRKASATKATRLRDHARGLATLRTDPAQRPFTTAPSPRVVPPVAPSPGVEAGIQAALAELAARPALPDHDAVVDTLKKALQQAQATAASANKLLRSTATIGPEERELAIVQSAMRSPLGVPSRSLLTGKDIVGFSQYAELDARWIATVWNHIFRSVVPFPVARSVSAVTSTLPAAATIAIAGDWGTGDDSSRRIAAAIAARTPTISIHLGDVYYSGTESEETDHLLALWPRGSVASFTLNSNHEMYSGGHGYFGVALTSDVFSAQKGSSYFALVNDDWVILGLDTAYAATSFFQIGALNEAQITWLRQVRAELVAKGPGGGRRKIMVLSHHEGRTLAGEPTLVWNQVTQALEVGPDYWYWGHEHGVAVFKPVKSGDADVYPRLLGHGGVPYIADTATGAMEWTEDGSVGVGKDVDPATPARSPNGLAILTLKGAEIAEELWDERGRKRWSRP